MCFGPVRSQIAVPRLPGGSKLRVGMKNQFVNDSRQRRFSGFELAQISLLKHDIDIFVTPDLDIIIIADNLASETEAGITAETIKDRLQGHALAVAILHDMIALNRMRVGRHQLAKDDIVHAECARKLQIADNLLDRIN